MLYQNDLYIYYTLRKLVYHILHYYTVSPHHVQSNIWIYQYNIYYILVQYNDLFQGVLHIYHFYNMLYYYILEYYIVV